MFQARALAWDKGKQYFAVARVGSDGHSFTMGEAPTGNAVDDSECNVACGDFQEFRCGCSDDACEKGMKALKGEDNVRRWAVYETPAKPKKEKKAKKDKKAKKEKKEKKAKKEADDAEL